MGGNEQERRADLRGLATYIVTRKGTVRDSRGEGSKVAAVVPEKRNEPRSEAYNGRNEINKLAWK